MEKELHNNIDERNALDAAAIATNTTTAGNIIDSLGHESLEYVAQLGTVTDGTYTLKVEHGDASNLSDAVVVPAAELLGALTAMAASDQVARVGYIGKKRYVRLSLVSAAVTTGVNFASAIAILGHPQHAPIAQ